MSWRCRLYENRDLVCVVLSSQHLKLPCTWWTLNEKRIFEAEGTLNKWAEFHMFLKEQVFCHDKTFALSRREWPKECSLGQFEVSCYTEAVLWEERSRGRVFLSREVTFVLRKTILVCVEHALRETGIWGTCDGWENVCLDRNVSGDFNLGLGWRRREESWMALRFVACPVKVESSGGEGRQSFYF